MRDRVCDEVDEVTASDIELLVIETLHDVAERQELTLPEGLSRDTCLFGKDGVLDSLALVTLVVELEREIQDRLKLQVTLTDDRAMSQKHSPFRTVTSLASYAERLVAELRQQ